MQYKLKIKKGEWLNGKRQEWKEDTSAEEVNMMKQKYQEINVRKIEIVKDI